MNQWELMSEISSIYLKKLTKYYLLEDKYFNSGNIKKYEEIKKKHEILTIMHEKDIFDVICRGKRYALQRELNDEEIQDAKKRAKKSKDIKYLVKKGEDILHVCEKLFDAAKYIDNDNTLEIERW